MILKDWAEIAKSVSVILASVFAIYGIDAWRREFVGKRQIELAEEVLALFYQARDVISVIRSPFGVLGEGASRKTRPEERPEYKEALDTAYILIERYNNHLDLFSRIYALRYRFMAQFGPDSSAPFDQLNKVINELLLSARRLARLNTVPQWSLRSDEALEKHRQELIKIDSIYFSGCEDDTITPRVDNLLADIERTCRSIIEGHGTLFSFINVPILKRRG